MKRILIILLLVGFAHAQDLKRPTAQASISSVTVGCRAGVSLNVSMPNAFDAAGLSTESDIGATAAYRGVANSATQFTNWQAPANAYTNLTLNINAFSQGYRASSTGSGYGAACMVYSTDGGVNWTNITCDSGGGWAQQTFSFVLNPAQDFTKLRVAVCASGISLDSPGDEGADNVEIFDIWTVGTSSTPPTPGTGSSAGQAHRGVVVVN